MSTKKTSIHPQFHTLLQKILPPRELEDFLNTRHQPLKKSITINTAKISTEDFLRITKERWWTLTPTPFLHQTNTFYIDRTDTSIPLGNTFLHQAWFFYIQEVAASLPATQIFSQAHDIILDMAAAPGGKTAQLASSILKHQQEKNWEKAPLGIVIANDKERKRVSTLIYNLRQWGYFNTLTTQIPGQDFWKYLPNFFDHVLLDAPCSGEGTGFKSRVAMQYRHDAEINKICGLQYQLLLSALQTVKVWGTVVYSTCTLNPFENEGVIAKMLSRWKQDIQLESLTFQGLDPGVKRKESNWQFQDTAHVARCRPHIQKTWGFFIAKIRKKRDFEKRKREKYHKLLPKNKQGFCYNKGLQKEISKYLENNRKIKINDTQHFFLADKEYIYLSSPQAMQILTQIHAHTVGIPILKKERNGYRPMHYLGNTLGHLARKNVIMLDDIQAQHYSEGKSLSWDKTKNIHLESWQKYYILTRRWYGYSIAKIVNEELKNKWKK